MKTITKSIEIETPEIKAGKRPEGMPFELYRVLRRVENLKVKKHLQGRMVWLSCILEEKDGILIKKRVMGTYTRKDQLIGSRS